MIRLHDLDLSATSKPASHGAAARVLLAQRLGQPTGEGAASQGNSAMDCALPLLAGQGVGAASDHWLGGDANLPTQTGETTVAAVTTITGVTASTTSATVARQGAARATIAATRR